MNHNDSIVCIVSIQFTKKSGFESASSLVRAQGMFSTMDTTSNLA